MQPPETLYGPSSSLLITGASSGIGAALAVHLAGYRGQLALVARRTDRLEQVAERVRAAGGSALALTCDVADDAAVAASHRQIVETHGPVTVAFLNAGIGGKGPIRSFSAATLRRVLDVNVMGVAHWLEALLPSMVEGGRGTIVGISSLAALRGLPGSGPYCASKAALSRLLESLRLEALALGIQISIAELGFVRSELSSSHTKKPFLMETEPAAQQLAAAVARGQGWIRFPWQTSAAMQLLHRMPASLYERVGASLVGKARGE